MLEFFPRAVPDQRQCRPRFSIPGSNLTIVLYEGSISFFFSLVPSYEGTNSSIVPSYEGTNSSIVPSYEGTNSLLEFFPRAVPDQRQCRPRFSISGSNLTIVLYEGSIFISTLLRGY